MPVIVKCDNCKKELKKNPCRVKKSNFCNNQCQANYGWNKRKKIIENTQSLISRRDKKYLIETRGNKCEICGIEKWRNKKIIMIMDHIDGNSEDNSLNNLRLICPNCDSQTSTYKGKNKGNGRYYRRKRYAEGKSY